MAAKRKRLELWDVTSGTRIRTLARDTAEVLSLALSADGRVLSSGHIDGSALVWDTHTGSCTLRTCLRSWSAWRVDLAGGAGKVWLVARERRYPSDLTDVEWAVVEPLLPAPTSHPRGGRPEKHPRRDVVDAILYVVRSGCAWRQLPVDFPPWETVYWYFTRWEQQKLTFRMADALRAQVRIDEDRDPDPSAGLMDSQSVKGADTVGAGTRGYDAGKKINGRKRFIVTDTLGLLLVVLVLPASVQDRDGAKKLLLELRHRQLLARAGRRVRHLFADGGFAGTLIDWASTTVNTTIEVVRKPKGQKGFAVIPRRWAVERTFAWLTAHRRLARDYERHPATAEAIIRWAVIATMTRRIARGQPATRPGPRQFTI